MNRISVAVLGALLIHGLLLWGPQWFAPKQPPQLNFRSVSVTLEQLSPVTPVEPVERAEPEPEESEEIAEPPDPLEELEPLLPEPVQEIDPVVPVDPVQPETPPEPETPLVPKQPPELLKGDKPEEVSLPVEPPALPATPAVSETPPEATPDSASEAAAPLVQEAYPLYKLNPPPTYPALARRRGWQGTVEVEVLVDVSGGVSQARVAVSSSHTILDEAALKAVRSWRFEPGRQGAESVAMWIKVPIRYNLQ